MAGDPGVQRPRQVRLGPLDHNLLADLEQRDADLRLVVHLAMKYRHLLRLEITRLRQGADPGGARAVLERWGNVLKDLKRLARGL